MKDIKPVTVGIIIAIMLVAYLILSATAPREPEQPPAPPKKDDPPPTPEPKTPAVEADPILESALEKLHEDGTTT